MVSAFQDAPQESGREVLGVRRELPQ